MKRKELDGALGCVALIGLIVLWTILIAIGLCIPFLMAWLLMIVLAAFNVTVGYWICFAMIILVSFVFGGIRASFTREANNG